MIVWNINIINKNSRNIHLRRRYPRPTGVPPLAPQMNLTLPLCHEDSKYVLSFEIGQREGGCPNQPPPVPHSNIDIYSIYTFKIYIQNIYKIYIFLYIYKKISIYLK